MFDLQRDSPVPIADQLMEAIREHIASGALQPGATLAEFRSLSQELLTNPQVVARAYAELEREGALRKGPQGTMEVTAGAALLCRLRLQKAAHERLGAAVTQARAVGLSEGEILETIERALAAARMEPLTGEALQQAIKKPTHETSHRASQGIQDLSRQGRP